MNKKNNKNLIVLILIFIAFIILALLSSILAMIQADKTNDVATVIVNKEGTVKDIIEKSGSIYINETRQRKSGSGC